MRRLITAMFLAGLGLGLGFGGPAGAYEYTLQYTPNSGARGLVVAGYAFSGDSVVGNCSYYTVSSGSGRGGGYHSTKTYYNQTCTWSLFGNLLSVVPGSPTAPAPLSTSGGVTVYAENAEGDTTGVDTARGNVGFVNTPSAQYEWVTPSSIQFLSGQKPLNLLLTLTNAGDRPLGITGFDPSAGLAKASVRWTTCTKHPIKTGATCNIDILYDTRGISRGDNPYTAYDTLTVGVVSNSGQAPDFTESIEIPIPAGG